MTRSHRVSACGGLLAIFTLALLGCGKGGGAGQQTQALECPPADPNALRFDHAVCLCESMSEIGNGLAAESLKAFVNLAPSTHKAHVGINGDVGSIGNLKVDGKLSIGGSLESIGNVSVLSDLLVGGDVENAGRIKVDGNSSIGGNLTGVGYFKTVGDLLVSGNLAYLGALLYQSVQQQVDFNPADPCDCSAGKILDVASIVASKKGAKRLSIASGIGHQDIKLTAGEYYAPDGSAFIGNAFLRIEGAVRLYVDGDVDTVGNRMIFLSEGAELDLYIAGSVRTVGNFMANVPKHHAASKAVRFYIGGEKPVQLATVGNEMFWGAVYAPKADVEFIGNLMVFGSLFARNIRGIGNIMVLYNAEIVGEDCTDPNAEPPTTDEDDPDANEGGGGNADPNQGGNTDPNQGGDGDNNTPPSDCPPGDDSCVH